MIKSICILAMIAVAGRALAQEELPAAHGTATVVPPAHVTLGDSVWEVRRLVTAGGDLAIVQNRGSEPLTLWDEAGGLAIALPPESAVSLPCAAGEVSGGYQLTDADGFNTALGIACGETVVLRAAG